MKTGTITNLERMPVKLMGVTTYRVVVDSIGFEATVSTKKELKKGDIIQFEQFAFGDTQEGEFPNIVLKLK